MWRGIFVKDVLLASGLQDQPDTERWYLNFEGWCGLQLGDRQAHEYVQVPMNVLRADMRHPYH